MTIYIENEVNSASLAGSESYFQFLLIKSFMPRHQLIFGVGYTCKVKLVLQTRACGRYKDSRALASDAATCSGAVPPACDFDLNV
jgi:hypothetical protein